MAVVHGPVLVESGSATTNAVDCKAKVRPAAVGGVGRGCGKCMPLEVFVQMVLVFRKRRQGIRASSPSDRPESRLDSTSQENGEVESWGTVGYAAVILAGREKLQARQVLVMAEGIELRHRNTASLPRMESPSPEI